MAKDFIDMTEFKPHRIPLEEARVGDIILYKGQGFLYQSLSWLIHILKERNWDRWGWHLAPIVKDNMILDAQFPKLKMTNYWEQVHAGREVMAYRIFEKQPSKTKVNKFVESHVGCPYDIAVYLFTAIAYFFRPKFDVPRLINRRYTCWEITFEFADEMGIDICDSYNYPFVTDLLRLCGELE
jgi:hypothetical protein